MTDQELKLKFFGLHLGCPLVRGGSRGTLQGISIDRFGKECAQTVFDGLVATIRIDNCRLLLKSLSEITDEDALKVANVMGYCDESWKVIRTESLITIESDSLDGELWIYLNNIDLIRSFYSEPMSDWSHAIDFLRSKGYALPYMGKHPFEEGWAIPVTSKQLLPEIKQQ